MQKFDLTAPDGPGVETLIEPDEEDSNVLVVNKMLDPGEGTDYHTHPDSTDLAVVLSGTAHVQTGGETADDAESVPLPAGTVVHIPPGESHALVNDGDEPCTFAFVQAPPDHEYTPGSRRDVSE